MASQFEMLIAGVSIITMTICMGLYTIVYGTFATYLFPLLQAYTPPGQWVALGGPFIVMGLQSFIWLMIILAEVLVFVNLWVVASHQVSYSQGGF